MWLLPWIGNVLICWGMWEIGNKKRRGFLWHPAGNLLWIAYSLPKGEWALAFICAVFAGLSIRAWLRWKESP